MYFPLVLALTEVRLEIDNGIVQMVDDEISLEDLCGPLIYIIILGPIRLFLQLSPGHIHENLSYDSKRNMELR